MRCSRSSEMSNSDRSRWKLSEQRMIWVRINILQHKQCSNMTSMTQQESPIKAKPGHRTHLTLGKMKTFSSRPPHRRTILKDWENKCIHGSNEATQRCPQRQVSPTSKYQSLRDTGDNTTPMVFEGEPALKLQAKNVKVGTSSNGNLRQDQFTMERVGSPGSTNHYILSFVRIQHHAPVIAPLLNPCQVPVKGGSNCRSVCWLANNCQ